MKKLNISLDDTGMSLDFIAAINQLHTLAVEYRLADENDSTSYILKLVDRGVVDLSKTALSFQARECMGDLIGRILETGSRWDARELAIRCGLPGIGWDKKWEKFNSRMTLELKKRESLGKKIEIERRMFDMLDGNPLLSYAELKAFSPDVLFDVKLVKAAWTKKLYRYIDNQRPLSEEQLLAISDSEQNTLLRARAGSGKTTVIKHKVDFLIKHAGYLPEAIIVLAFNKTTAEKIKKELQTQFNHLTFSNSRTFHSLAYQLVFPEGCPDNMLLFDKGTGANAIQSRFVENLLKHEINPQVRADIHEFFRNEMKELENIGSLLNKNDYYTLRRNSTQDTLKGDSVKSIGEKWLADFLFEHGVRYFYEAPWYRDATGRKGSYYPDFTLAVANGKSRDVVIEHWGIDEFSVKRTVPEHWSQTWDEYRQDMVIKREYWRKWNATNPSKTVIFLESSILDMVDGREAFERIIKEKFTTVNIQLDKLPAEELIEKVVRKQMPRLAKMCLQYINKAKKCCLSPIDIDRKIQSYRFSCEKEEVFNQLANRIYHRYQTDIVKQNKIDYDDLMAMAVEAIHEAQGNVTLFLTREASINLNDIKWIMIDEYQDFSQLFFNLIQAIRRYNPSVRLFCVGDNWQAINGFAGSDLTYFDNFREFFDDASLLDLRNNYRSQPNIVHQGNRFMADSGGLPSIAKAPLPEQPLQRYLTNQVFIEQRKQVSNQGNPDFRYLSLIQSRGEEQNMDVNAVMARQFKLCRQLMLQYPLANTSFMILSRGNYQAYAYENLNKFKQKLKTCFDRQELKLFRDFNAQVQCMTAHRSKGAEADVVILLNVNVRKFPIIHPDNALYFLLGDTLLDIYREEERLFYVAITRAKNALYILTEQGRESEFLSRIDAPIYKFQSTDTTNRQNSNQEYR